MITREVALRSIDGLELGATVLIPESPVAVTVLVHGGGGVDRHEWHGLYDRLASQLAVAGVASVAFDHRCYLSAQDPAIDLTIAGVANDIGTAIAQARTQLPGLPVHIIAGSFSAGAAVLWAGHHPCDIASLVLLYPLLDYRQRILETKPWWNGTSINEAAAERLKSDGTLRHIPRVPISRALINEASLFDCEAMLRQLTVPVLLAHGTKDKRIPYEVSARLARSLEIDLMTIEGADHGFSIPGDTEHTHPQTRAFQQLAFDHVADWIN